MLDQKLSEHFTLSELTRTSTGLKNEPSVGAITNLKRLSVCFLEVFREYINSVILINSGYRSKEVNKAVGGSLTSDHMDGTAVDIRVPKMTPIQLWKKIIGSGIQFKQVILEHDKENCVHVSFASDRLNKCQAMIRFKDKLGKIRYIQMTKNDALLYNGDYKKFMA